jgi:hypothetical protein
VRYRFTKIIVPVSGVNGHAFTVKSDVSLSLADPPFGVCATRHVSSAAYAKWKTMTAHR